MMDRRFFGGRLMFAHDTVCIVLLVCGALICVSSGQVQVTTSHLNNERTGANTSETLLTPANVNKNNFGRLFNYPIDYQSLAQPLYVPNVTIPGLGTHNVVYVATMADSVYAFDADSNVGANASPLWHVNFTDPANGITTAARPYLPCTRTETSGPGFTQEGIVSTPVIDTTTGTMYLVAKTLETLVVRHRLHALDITNGQERPGWPILISATSTSIRGHVTNFNSLHQKNRPGLLLLNGVVYLGFGSNYCNDSDTGWVLGYDTNTLQQVGAFNTSPDIGLTSIWQSGQGLTADDEGNIYVTTAESGNYDVPSGGQSFSNSILRLSTNPFGLDDYFTPWNVAFLNNNDLDVSSSGPLLLPDQDGPNPHILVTAAKEGTIYVLNREHLGFFGVDDSQIVQELPLVLAGELMNSPTYWNGTIYFSADNDFIKGYAVSSGQLSSVPAVTSTQILGGSHSPSISSNGTANGVLWVINGSQLWAFDASTLTFLYNTKQVPTRDTVPAISHFITQSVANGRVYIATRSTLEVFGLLHNFSIVGGANQSALVGTTLPVPIQLQTSNPYSGAGISGVAVSFSDGGKGGTFNPPSAITDDSGFALTAYTLPQKSGTYTITATAQGFGNVTFTETALPGPAVKMIAYKGNNQTGPAGSVLPVPLSAKALDALGNGVPGITVAFDDQGKGGSFNPNPNATDASGLTHVSYTLPTVPGKYKILVSSQGLKTITFVETAQ